MLGERTTDPDRVARLSPPRSVPVNAFCIDRTEVTVEAYRTCVDHGDCIEPHRDGAVSGVLNCAMHACGKLYEPLECRNVLDRRRSDRPVTCVSFLDAANYCRRMGRRLPTLDERELAARGCDGRVYPWGNSESTAQRASSGMTDVIAPGTVISLMGPEPVGSHPQGHSPFGVLDMVGSVYEWTSTRPVNAERGVLVGGSCAWLDSPRDDPSLELHSLTQIHAAAEVQLPEDFAGYTVGFRCARSLPND